MSEEAGRIFIFIVSLVNLKSPVLDLFFDITINIYSINNMNVTFNLQ